MTTGSVGPGHAGLEARLRILSQDPPSHRIVQRQVAGEDLERPEAGGPGHRPKGGEDPHRPKAGQHPNRPEAGGPGHRLFIAVPRGTPPAAGWPVLTLLDGNAAFDALTPDLLARASGLVLVGVGYATEKQFARERRTLDFTAPDGPGDGIRPDPVHSGRMAGGAAMFLDRLTGPLRGAAEAGLAVDPARRTLWGHSFGGLFTLYAALTRPGAFAAHAAISPSIWWDEPLIRRVAARAPPMADPPRLMIALGDREQRSGSGGPPPDGPAPATMAFAARLPRHPGIVPEVHVLPGLRHIETLAASLPLAFRLARG